MKFVSAVCLKLDKIVLYLGCKNVFLGFLHSKSTPRSVSEIPVYRKTQFVTRVHEAQIILALGAAYKTINHFAFFIKVVALDFSFHFPQVPPHSELLNSRYGQNTGPTS
jgi:hypothetical protein